MDASNGTDLVSAHFLDWSKKAWIDISLVFPDFGVATAVQDRINTALDRAFPNRRSS